MANTGAAREERREQQRRHLYFFSRVFDEDTHELAGRLVDISGKGMMMVSEKPIKANQTFKFKLVLPGAVGGKRTLILEAKSRWSTKAAAQDHFDNGFELVNISSRDARMIGRLTADLGPGYGKLE